MRGAFLGLVCTALLASSGVSAADAYRPDQYRPDAYRPDQFLGLDLSKAVLSPKPLGPATEFAPVAVEAKGERSSEVWWARNELKTEPKKVAVQKVRAARVHVAAPVRDGRPHVAARTKLARRHSNPLDS